MNGTASHFARWAVVAAVFAVVAFVAFRPVSSVENVSAAQLGELAASGVRVIDVRTPAEFNVGHIPGAELVPVAEIASVAAGWDRAEPLVIYCATGQRSSSAVQFLSEQGFETVYHFNAGIVAWTGPLEQGTTTAAAPERTPATADTPVMYEFFTDW